MSEVSEKPSIPPPPGAFLKVFSYVIALPTSLLAMIFVEEAWRYVGLFFLLVLLEVAFMCLGKLHDIQNSQK